VMTLQIKVNPVKNDTRQAFDFFPMVNSIRPYHPKANVILLENNEEWIVSHWFLQHPEFIDIEFYPRAKYKLIFSIEAHKLSELIVIQLSLRDRGGSIF
ncbi:MAG: hypothetical protein AAFO87_00530, partial [Cyanobacteria bacterium J06607_6]